MAQVSLRGIRKSFGSVAALDGIDLDISDGENLAVLGPSGSGKSTLLRIIAGLEDGDSGSVLFDGRDQAGIPPHHRDAAIVFQHFALYPHLSALENITLGLRHGLGLPKAEAVARARDLAGRMQIEPLLERKPKQMSGGQRQRVALARALARRSSIVLLDEPLSGLDAQLHATLRLEIASMLRAVGATGINVTHDQLDAMAMADRIAVIHHGRLEQVGTPDELYSAPDTLFVASFIGTPPMTLIEVDDRGESSFEAGGGGVVGFPMTLGVRAEDFALMPRGDEPGRAWAVSGIVGIIEPAGRDRVVSMLTERGDTVAFRCDKGISPAPGEYVTVAASAKDVHVYDRSTGRRVGTALEVGLDAEIAR